MFKLADPQQSYAHPVTVQVPVGNNSWRSESFNAEFRLLSTAEFQALFAPDNLTKRTDQEVISTFLTGWSDIHEYDGGELKYSDVALAKLCDLHYWARAVVEAYIEFHAGQPSKNFATPLGTG